MSESAIPEDETEEPEEKSLALADPDNYHQTQRLREIHLARRHSAKAIKKGHTRYKRGGSQERHHLAKIGHTLATYVAEIEPLIEATGYDDTLNNHLPWDSLREFATYAGMPTDERGFPEYDECSAIFRECNKFLAEVKPLIVEEDDSDPPIIGDG